MTTGLSYDGTVAGTDSFIVQLSELAVVPQNDINFVNILPMAITYAENRILRDLDLLSAMTPFYDPASPGFLLATGNRFINLPVDTFMTVQSVALVFPQGSTLANGVRQPMLPVSREFIDNVYGDAFALGVPKYFAILSQGLDPVSMKFSFQLMLGPTPDADYLLDIYGSQRPPSLSEANLTTFVSLYLSELMLMAAMVYISGYQRNWSGASANDPQMPVNYEQQYQTLLKNAMGEEARKRFQASGWTALAPAPAASPARV